MSLRKFYRLQNEATEIDTSGGASEDVFGSNDTPLEPGYAQTMTDLGLDPNKYGLNESQDDELKAESQGSEEAPEDAQATEESSFLERINALGAIHNDLPVKVESLEDLKNLVQMGKDYTVKTQSLSEERKAWDAEKSSTETELNAAIEEFNTAQKAHGQQLQEMQQWTFALNQLKESAPDIFEEVQRAYEGTVRQFSNPVLDQQLASIRAELAEAKKGISERENSLVLDKFESEKGALSATEQSLKELGINVDWNEVKKQWASTGLPLKQVVGSIYFENVTKAQASKAKVETTKQKVAAKPVGVASNSRPGAKVPQINRKLNYFEQAQELYKNMK